MEQIYFGHRIAALRKARGMTQEALAQKLGITNQAVSKWESDQCCPDIMQLPALADIFEISMDALFGRAEIPTPAASAETIRVEDLPWEDNEDLHAVCYLGHRLVQYKDIPSVGGKRDRFQFSFSCMGFEKTAGWANEPMQLAFSGNVGNIYSDYSVNCINAEIGGNIQAGDSVSCGNVCGDVHAGDSVSCGAVGGNVYAGEDAECGGDIMGRIQCQGDLECQGSIHGDVRADGDVRCSGDISGNVTADGDVDCTGSIGGNASADGDITCGNIYGSASAEGEISCPGLTGL